MTAEGQLKSSFRDPAGFLFRRNDTLLRQVNLSYQAHFEKLIASGLYQELVADSLLIAHEDVSKSLGQGQAFKIIKPEPIDFISYPYEWCFSELKDAALLTLEIQKRALGKDMTLKDASAFNIQFRAGKPIFIDSLSFEIYKQGSPWIAYRQFCQHFLAPLACMSYLDVRLNQLLRVFIDGIPLDLAVSILPWRARLRFGLLTHLYFHAWSQKQLSEIKERQKKRVSKFSQLALIDSLESTLRALNWKMPKTVWRDYYRQTTYSDRGTQSKKEIVRQYIEKVAPKIVWDVGANTGDYGRIASDNGISTVTFELDPVCVELSYQELKRQKKTTMLPLVMDFTNPSAALGFANQERDELAARGPADLVLCLAFMHHMSIANNVPFAKLAQYLRKLCKYLVIEFVPKTDSRVRHLLASREDIFEFYSKEHFEQDFASHFAILDHRSIIDSERTIYLMQAKT